MSCGRDRLAIIASARSSSARVTFVNARLSQGSCPSFSAEGVSNGTAA